MDTAKIFINGSSQAVRLPKKYRFKSDRVLIFKRDNEVILKEQPLSWDEFFAEPSVFGEDYLDERDNDIPQERKF